MEHSKLQAQGKETPKAPPVSMSADSLPTPGGDLPCLAVAVAAFPNCLLRERWLSALSTGDGFTNPYKLRCNPFLLTSAKQSDVKMTFNLLRSSSCGGESSLGWHRVGNWLGQASALRCADSSIRFVQLSAELAPVVLLCGESSLGWHRVGSWLGQALCCPVRAMEGASVGKLQRCSVSCSL